MRKRLGGEKSWLGQHCEKERQLQKDKRSSFRLLRSIPFCRQHSPNTRQSCSIIQSTHCRIFMKDSIVLTRPTPVQNVTTSLCRLTVVFIKLCNEESSIVKSEDVARQARMPRVKACPVHHRYSGAETSSLGPIKHRITVTTHYSIYFNPHIYMVAKGE